MGPTEWENWPRSAVPGKIHQIKLILLQVQEHNCTIASLSSGNRQFTYAQVINNMLIRGSRYSRMTNSTQLWRKNTSAHQRQTCAVRMKANFNSSVITPTRSSTKNSLQIANRYWINWRRWGMGGGSHAVSVEITDRVNLDKTGIGVCYIRALDSTNGDTWLFQLKNSNHRVEEHGNPHSM